MNVEKRPDTGKGLTASPVPADIGIIRISAEANAFIDQWASDLLQDRLQVWQLPPGLQAFWTLAYDEGARSRQLEIDRANTDADRLYARLYTPSKELKPAPASYSEMERRRGNNENAERYDKWLNDLLGGFGRSTT